MKNQMFLISFCFCMTVSCAGFSAPLSGTYTIGGSSPNYMNLTSAVNDLVSSGVNGPVTFNIRSGTYVEQVSIPPITGASASNRITIKSETEVAADVTISFSNTSAKNYVIQLSGASFITIKYLTITTTEPTKNYGCVLSIINQASYDSISSNNLIGLQNTTWTGSNQVIMGYPHNGTSVVINNNILNYGTIGIILQGSDNAANVSKKGVIKNNIITNFFGWGISANYMKDALIEGNVLTTAPTTSYGSIPIYIQNIVYPICVSKNRITIAGANAGIAGMYIVNNHPFGIDSASIISNNFISMKNGTGLLLINNDYFKFYHNTVNVISSGGCFNVYGNSTGNILGNNIFNQSGNQSAISASPAAAVTASDYNNIYTTSSTFGSWNGANCVNLSAWQTASGMDNNSRSLIPSFLSTTDLHLSSYANMQFGSLINSVPDDLDGQTRHVPPAVGADDSGSIYTGDPLICCACGNQLLAGFTADSTTICPGGTVSFTDKSLNSPSSWNWTFTGGIPSTSTLQNPTVTYALPGSYNVKLVVTNVNGKDSITKVGYVTVRSFPEAGAVNVNPDTICEGGASVLTSIGGSGTIEWQSSADGLSFTTIAGANSASFNTPNLNGPIYYRTRTTGICGTDSSNMVQISVWPEPVPVLAANDTIICSGDSASICASGEYSYLWNTGESTTCVFAKSAGGYWITATDVNGCTAISSHQNIEVYPIPSVSIVVQGDTLSSFNAISYQWYRNDTLIPGANTAIYIAQISGGYSVQVTDNNGCMATSTNVQITIAGLDSEIFNEDPIILPNPFANSVQIEMKQLNEIEIRDILGREVFLSSRIINESNVLLDLSRLSNGIYLMKLKTSKSEVSKKIIKN